MKFKDFARADSLAACRQCIFWAVSDDEAWGQCRRNAPKAENEIVELAGRIPVDRIEVLWPMTSLEQWCGEGQFEARAEEE